MSFRTRFNLSETATESLIKFMKLVLKEIGGNGFDSLYLTKKSLVGLQDNFCHFVLCSNCYKLYRKNDITEFHQDGILAIMKCRHVEYQIQHFVRGVYAKYHYLPK